MSTADSQERLKEAKAIQTRIDTIVAEDNPVAQRMRTLMIIAGMITETLLEYEEPDVVMEQTFHRISDLLGAEPAEDIDETSELPPAWLIDRDTETGRTIAREAARRLPKEMDDLHEIAIALVLNDFQSWEQQGQDREILLRLLIECVIAALMFEMGTQDFCDMLIEDFISEGYPVQQSLMGLAALSGYYLGEAVRAGRLPHEDGEKQLTGVMAREAARHGTPGPRNWAALGAVNDLKSDDVIAEYVVQLREPAEEFFDLIGLEDNLGRSVTVARAVGRMVAVTTVDEATHIQTSVAKTLARTGLLMGARMREQAMP